MMMLMMMTPLRLAAVAAAGTFLAPAAAMDAWTYFFYCERQ
jgi:hypothetical protein